MNTGNRHSGRNVESPLVAGSGFQRVSIRHALSRTLAQHRLARATNGTKRRPAKPGREDRQDITSVLLGAAPRRARDRGRSRGRANRAVEAWSRTHAEPRFLARLRRGGDAAHARSGRASRDERSGGFTASRLIQMGSEPLDVVVLHRVVCCYPSYERLLATRLTMRAACSCSAIHRQVCCLVSCCWERRIGSSGFSERNFDSRTPDADGRRRRSEGTSQHVYTSPGRLAGRRLRTAHARFPRGGVSQFIGAGG
jgi:hypothetical protein